MTAPIIPKEAGRAAFGLDPAGYHAARPAYPEWVYERLVERGGLGPGCSTFEIGPGTGTATRRLLELGAGPLVAVEPDARLAEFLRRDLPDPALEVRVSTFEAAELASGAFDLGVSATAFHWLDEAQALAKIATLLKPGGWWAAVWNVFGDAERPDPFHDATHALLAGPSSPSQGDGGVPFALDAEARVAAIRRCGGFDMVEAEARPWSLVLNAEQTVALYATYSNINVRPDREAVLAEIGRIAREAFGGRVTRNMVTSLYVARHA